MAIVSRLLNPDNLYNGQGWAYRKSFHKLNSGTVHTIPENCIYAILCIFFCILYSSILERNVFCDGLRYDCRSIHLHVYPSGHVCPACGCRSDIIYGCLLQKH